MTGSQEGRAVAFPQADALWSRVLHPERMASMGGVGDGLDTGALLAIPSALSLEPQKLSPWSHPLLMNTSLL